MMSKVEISVIMPCYNVEKYVAEAIESILNQTYSNFELLIINDGSTDRTWEICNSYKDSRIKLCNIKTNQGNYYARNLGIQISKGKYIAMLDADDLSLPQRLMVQHSYLKNFPQIGAVGSNYYHIDQNSNVVFTEERECNYEEFKFKLLSDNYLLQSTLFMRKDFIQRYKIGYNESFRFASDYHFVFQCSKYFPIHNIKDNIVKYRTHPNNITQTHYNEQQDFARIIRKEIFEFHYPSINNTDLEYIDFLFARRENDKIVNLESLANSLDKILDLESRFKHFGEDCLFNLFQDKLENLYHYNATKSIG